MLTLVLTLTTCKKSGGNQQSNLDRDVQLVSIDNTTSLLFQSLEPAHCQVTVDDSYLYECKKVASIALDDNQKIHLYSASLGKLTDKMHLALEIWQEGQSAAEASLRNYTYYRATESVADNYSSRLDVPLLVAEIYRTTSLPDIGAGPTGCQVDNAVANSPQHSEQPLELDTLYTKGYAEAKASSHRHNRKYFRLQYHKTTDKDRWGYYYLSGEQATYFTVKPPATFASLTVAGGQKIELISKLQEPRKMEKLSAGNELVFAWQLNNAGLKTALTISLVSDDKQVSARCLSDPTQQEMRLDRALLQKLPAGKYSLLVQVASWQRVMVQGLKNVSWLVVGYDWRYARLEKS